MVSLIEYLIETEEGNSKSKDSYTVSVTETVNQSIKYSDFDPVFRKAEFQDVRKGALEMMQYNKINCKFNE